MPGPGRLTRIGTSLRRALLWRRLPPGALPAEGTAAARTAAFVRRGHAGAALALLLLAAAWGAVLDRAMNRAAIAADHAVIAARQPALALRLAQLDIAHPDSGELGAFDTTLAQMRRDTGTLAGDAGPTALQALLNGPGYNLHARLSDLFDLARHARTADDPATRAQLTEALRREIAGPVAAGLTDAADLFAAASLSRARTVTHRLQWAVGSLALFALAWMAAARSLDRRLRRTLGLLEYLAARDGLTGALTHNAFAARLHRLLQRGRVGLVLLDLDRFHALNATSGDAAGDAALRAVARRLTRTAGPQALVARLGSDSFAVALPGLDGGYPALATQADRLLATLRDPIPFQDQLLHIAASAGTALAPEDSAVRAELLRMAGVAVRQAKRETRGVVRAFHAVEPAAQARREAVLRALSDGDLAGVEPWLQPLVRCDTGEPVRFEVLARWTHPTLGRIAPAEFLPIAEAVGRLPMLSAQVRNAAFLALAALHREEPADLPARPGLAVNLAPSELATPGLLAAVEAALAAAELAPSSLTIEVTEDLLIEGVDSDASARLQALRGRGARVNLDNFGSGTANLAHLRDFEMDGLKIARPFIAGIGQNGRTETIIRGMLGLCRGLGIEAVAEGIETEAQLRFMRDAGCEVAQGYLIGAPMPPDAVRGWLEQWREKKAVLF